MGHQINLKSGLHIAIKLLPGPQKWKSSPLTLAKALWFVLWAAALPSPNDTSVHGE